MRLDKIERKTFILFSCILFATVSNCNWRLFAQDVKVNLVSDNDLSLYKTVLKLFEDPLTQSDIESISKLGNENIQGYGQAELYQVKLASSVPSVLYGDYIMLLGKERTEAALFFLSDLKLIRIHAEGESSLLAGTSKGRNYGFFTVYAFDGDRIFKRIFTSMSDEFCNTGIPTYNNSLDCISYQSFNLNFENKDVNDDGLLDLSFSGEVNYFCEGLEVGIGRVDRTPLKTEPISFTFISKKSMDKSGFIWELLDENICDKNLINPW